jgi:hypothetical protein
VNASAPRRINRAGESHMDTVKTPWFMSRTVNRRLMMLGIVLNLAGLLALALMVVMDPNRGLSAGSVPTADPDLVAETKATLPVRVSPPPAPVVTTPKPATVKPTPNAPTNPAVKAPTKPLGQPSLKPTPKPLEKPASKPLEKPATSPVTPPVAAKPLPTPVTPPAATPKPNSSAQAAAPVQTPVQKPVQTAPTQPKPVQAAPAPQPVQTQAVRPNPVAPAGQAVASAPKVPPATVRPTPPVSSPQPAPPALSVPPQPAPTAPSLPVQSAAPTPPPRTKTDIVHNQGASATGLNLQTSAATDGWSQTCALIVDARTLEPRLRPSSSPQILSLDGEIVWPPADLQSDLSALENEGIALFASSTGEARVLLGSSRRAVTVDAVVSAADPSGASDVGSVYVSPEDANLIRSLNPRCRVVFVR